MKWLLGFVSWNTVARLLQIGLASAGAYLISKGLATEDLVGRASAIIVEVAALIWINFHGANSQPVGRKSLLARTFKGTGSGGTGSGAVPSKGGKS
jgi:hypothetical protein